MSDREAELESQLVATQGELGAAVKQRDDALRQVERLRFPRTRPVLADDRPRDFLGRGQPRKLDAALLFRAIPGLSSQFQKHVPDEFWGQDVEDGDPVATLACPCGEDPRPKAGSFAACECGRIYLFTGDRVHVAYGEDFDGPEDDPQEVTPEPSVE